jgi:hypothetical protein
VGDCGYLSYEDRDGALWLVTAGGLARLNDGPVTTWTTTQGLPSRFVWAVHQDRSGTLWVGTSGGGVARLLSDRTVAPPPFSHPDLLGVEIRASPTGKEPQDRHGGNARHRAGRTTEAGAGRVAAVR